MKNRIIRRFIGENRIEKDSILKKAQLIKVGTFFMKHPVFKVDYLESKRIVLFLVFVFFQYFLRHQSKKKEKEYYQFNPFHHHLDIPKRFF